MEQIQNQSFPSKTICEWKEKAEQSLKGKTVESLQRTTYENIILKPLYIREEKQTVPDFPGGPDLRRGTDPLGYITKAWKVAQNVTYQTPEELKQNLYEAVRKGQTALSFELTKELLDEKEGFFGDLDSSLPFAVNSKWLQADFTAYLKEHCGNKEKVTGYTASDPISLFAQEGFVSEEFIQAWTEDIKRANEWLPRLRTVLIDTTPYHSGGANAVQELGIAVAEGVFYIQELLEKGFSIESALSKLVFQFSIGSNFFMEVAKLRAARIVWNRITEVYGCNGADEGMCITAETSSFTKTLQDPYVNLLRAGNEAFAAVLGGVHYLKVSPFDELTGSNSFSERIARNVQLILKEEAHLQKVIDPAGGSWYIEALTSELAEKAWTFFQEIEANGGIVEALKTNWIQEKIAMIYIKRNKDIQTRKQSIIGTNVYANPDDTVLSAKRRKSIQPVFDHNKLISINAIPKRRLSEPYEELRAKAKKLQDRGIKLEVAVLCLGELWQYKARLDFMKGFVRAGGIEPVESDSIFSTENARKFIKGLTTDIICLCGTNEQYETFGHQLLSDLKTEFPSRVFLLAGLPEKEKQNQWEKEGIEEFIHVKSNCYETLSSILFRLEVTDDEEAKA